ncbi:hypothetical protein HH308_28955 [Gordonia sp. TBRC 11910]|uniref:Sugar lactone lactonase YvrE n=1 Tax=Gordonia asplenii TaxID=2725283 RepID=A0A848L8G6_9ACTN|nr:hypothetical protein [Gordonia asplenii]NMO05255.1 hypothetical protein [Gordonia asplenii]
MTVSRLRTVVRALAATVLAVSALAAPAALGPAQAVTGCPGVSVSRLRAASTPVIDWAENLTFDAAGNLWVARGQRGVVERYAPDGRRTASIPVVEPGAVRVGPDGLLYVASGDATHDMIPATPLTGAIVRLDPRAAQPNPRVFATGLGMPNGMAFGPDDNLYVADGRLGLLRITRRGSIDAAWSARAPKSQLPSAVVNGFGLNGIAASGENLYVTMTSSTTGRVLRVPVDDPAQASVAADLTAPLPGILDDLIAPHPDVLAVASTVGQAITVNLRTHSTCARGVGQPITALAADPRRPGTVVAGTESGDLLRLTFAGHPAS